MPMPCRPKYAYLSLICLTAATLLSACSKPAPVTEEAASYEAAPLTETSEPAQTTQTANIPDVPQLAYDYHYTLSAAEGRLKGLMQTHENACLMAGAARCQIVSSGLVDLGQATQATHTLSLRAAPEWLRLFRDGLEAQVSSIGGEIIAQSIDGEDLSPALVDVNAHIANKVALRDRLKTVVRSHNGKINDLIAAEQQLSEVQGEIDTARAQQALMQKRVRMANLTLTYRLNSLTSARGTFAPLAQALDNVVPTFVGALSFLIQAIALLLPLGLITGPFIWLALRRKRKPVITASAGDTTAD